MSDVGFLAILHFAQAINEEQPIARVLRDHYRTCPEGMRPRILSMISPGDLVGEYGSRHLRVEALLFSRLFGIPEVNRTDETRRVARPADIIASFESPPRTINRTELYKRMESVVGGDPQWIAQFQVADQV